MGPGDIQQILTTYGMQAQHLSTLLCVSEPTVNRWLNGNAKPTGFSVLCLNILRRMQTTMTPKQAEELGCEIVDALVLRGVPFALNVIFSEYQGAQA